MSELLVKDARHKIGHILVIEFNDGHKENVDFSSFIFSSHHPDDEKYKWIDEFIKFDIIDGNLNWDDYAMIFPVEDLYRNRLVK